MAWGWPGRPSQFRDKRLAAYLSNSLFQIAMAKQLQVVLLLLQVENDELVIYDQRPREIKALLNKPEEVTAEGHRQHSKRIVAAVYGHDFKPYNSQPDPTGQGAFSSHQPKYQEIGRGAFGAVRFSLLTTVMHDHCIQCKFSMIEKNLLIAMEILEQRLLRYSLPL